MAIVVVVVVERRIKYAMEILADAQKHHQAAKDLLADSAAIQEEVRASFKEQE